MGRHIYKLSVNYIYVCSPIYELTVKNEVKNGVIKMIKEKTKLALAIGLALLGIVLYVSISAAFVVLLLGLVVVPPAVVMVSIFVEGTRIFSERMNSLPESKKESNVIYISS